MTNQPAEYYRREFHGYIAYIICSVLGANIGVVSAGGTKKRHCGRPMVEIFFVSENFVVHFFCFRVKTVDTTEDFVGSSRERYLDSTRDTA